MLNVYVLYYEHDILYNSYYNYQQIVKRETFFF